MRIRSSWWLVVLMVVGASAGVVTAQDARHAAQNVPSAPRLRGRLNAPSEATRVEGSGRFDARFVVRMIRTRQAALTACYERELRSEPTLEGTVVLTIRIEESGAVSAVRALPESTLSNAAVAACVTGVVQRFGFASGPEGGPFTAVMTLGFEPQTP